MRLVIACVCASACSFSSKLELPADASGEDAFEQMIDAPGTGTDAPTTSTTCYGPMSSPFSVCLAAAPTNMVSLPAMLDTTPGMSSLCLQAQPTGWTAAQPTACFVVGNRITIATTVVVGTRPLVLVAHDQISVTGTLDVASHRGGTRGPASPSMLCGAFAQNAGNSGNGAGGGAGGSFRSKGGEGGRGNVGVGGEPNPVEMVVQDRLRAGCDAQTGGSGEALAGTAGRGGGVVYLAAGTSIQVTGIINASGSGGGLGGDRSGGSGGGSGGMIVLHAPTIGGTGRLVANGGAGAAGGNKNGDGNPGSDPDPASSSAATGGVGAGGTGGKGFALGSAAEDGASNTNGDHGGGGGGGGAGYIRTNVTFGGFASPTREML